MRNIFTLVLVLLTLCSGQALAEYYVVNDASEQELNTIDNTKSYQLTGPGKTLSFEAKKGTLAVSGYFFAQYSSDNSNWYDLNSSGLSLGSSYKSYSYTLPSDAKYVRFKTKTGATLYKYVKNVKVTMDEYINQPSVSSLDFGNVKMKENKEMSFSYTYCNVGDIQVFCTNPVFSVSVSDSHTGQSTDNSAFAGTQTVTVKFSPTAEGSQSDNLSIVSTKGTITIPLSGIGLDYHEKPVIDPYPHVAYPVTDSTWTDTVAYNTELKDIPLVGGAASVEGTFGWADSTLQLGAGYDQQIPALFTPADTSIYKIVNFKVTLHVKKASQTLTWDQDFSDLHIGDSIRLTGSSSAWLKVYYTSADSSKADIVGNYLVARDTTSASTGVAITIHQDGTTNYEAAEASTKFVFISQLEVVKKDQLITWEPSAYTAQVGDTVILHATSDKGDDLPITYSAPDGECVRISGDTLFALAPGTDIQLNAYQAGNDTLNAKYGYATLTITAPSALQEVDTKQQDQKFLQRGSLYIRRNDHVYNAKGQLVK